MLCGLFCALRVLTSGPVHTLMAKDTEGEQKMDEYYQVVQTLPQWLARPLGQLPSEDAETGTGAAASAGLCSTVYGAGVQLHACTAGT